jgi:hypothetical protein
LILLKDGRWDTLQFSNCFKEFRDAQMVRAANRYPGRSGYSRCRGGAFAALIWRLTV